MKFSKIDKISARSSCLHLDDRSTHEKKFRISKFASFLDLLPEFDSNLIEFCFCLFRVWLNHLISATTLPP
jgi:hypothetical protein